MRFLFRSTGLLCALLLMSPPLLARSPAFVPLQGFLTDSEDQPVDGETILTLNLYAADTTETPLFSEQHSVMVDRGFFTLYLGSIEVLDPLLFRDNDELFLGITIGDDEEMAPRLVIGSVPWALFSENAENARTLGGMQANDFIAVGDDIAWEDVTGVPGDIADGDDDSLSSLVCADGQLPKWDAGGNQWVCAEDIDSDTDTMTSLGCADGQVAKWISGAWICADDSDTLLTEDEVDGYVADNGYALAVDLAAVAFSGSFSDLSDIPADQDTLGNLGCADGQLPKWDAAGAQWVCAEDIDNDSDTLAALSCADGQLPKWNSAGGSWMCADDIDNGFTSEAELTALLDDNYLALDYLPQWGEVQNIPAGFADDIDDVDDAVEYNEVASIVGSGPGTVAAGSHLHDGDQITSAVSEAHLAYQANAVPWSGISGMPAGFADGVDDDSDTQYSAGAGLVLVGTEFQGRGSHFANLVTVAAGGGDFSSVQAAVDNITDASADNPYLIWIAPGVYTGSVVLKPHVHLRGSGRGATRITSDISGTSSIPYFGTVEMDSDTSLSNLTVENNSVTDYSCTVYAQGDSNVHFSHIDVISEGAGGTRHYGFHLVNCADPAVLHDVETRISGASQNRGIYINGASAVMHDCRIHGAFRAAQLRNADVDALGCQFESENITIWAESAGANCHLKLSGCNVRATQSGIGTTFGMYIVGPQVLVEASDVNISIEATSTAYGAWVLSEANLVYNGGSIKVANPDGSARGLEASGMSTSIKVQNAYIEASGITSTFGISERNGASIEVSHSVISSSNASANMETGTLVLHHSLLEAPANPGVTCVACSRGTTFLSSGCP